MELLQPALFKQGIPAYRTVFGKQASVAQRTMLAAPFE
jgi:hypothetical protein